MGIYSNELHHPEAARSGGNKFQIYEPYRDIIAVLKAALVPAHISRELIPV